MKGDFSRSTFRRQKHYSSVRMQQGRVQLDADWNEQLDINAYRIDTETRDVIGLCGAPKHNAGFQLIPQGNDFKISKGRYYVDGILCENETDILASAQLDLPATGLPSNLDWQVLPTDPGLYLACLDVSQRHLTALDEPAIREVALGGPDTATRTKTVWQVKLLKVGEVGDPVNCSTSFPLWDQLISGSSGQLRARAKPDPLSDDP